LAELDGGYRAWVCGGVGGGGWVCLVCGCSWGGLGVVSSWGGGGWFFYWGAGWGTLRGPGGGVWGLLSFSSFREGGGGWFWLGVGGGGVWFGGWVLGFIVLGGWGCWSYFGLCVLCGLVFGRAWLLACEALSWRLGVIGRWVWVVFGWGGVRWVLWLGCGGLGRGMGGGGGGGDFSGGSGFDGMGVVVLVRCSGLGGWFILLGGVFCWGSFLGVVLMV